MVEQVVAIPVVENVDFREGHGLALCSKPLCKGGTYVCNRRIPEKMMAIWMGAEGGGAGVGDGPCRGRSSSGTA